MLGDDLSANMTLRDYVSYLCHPTTDLSIRLAVAAVMLTFADPLLMTDMQYLAPLQHHALTMMDAEARRRVFGTPAATAFLGVCTWMDLRRLRR